MIKDLPRVHGIARRLFASPHLHEIECDGEVTHADAKIELYGTGKLPRCFERFLERFYNTRDKQRLLQLSVSSRLVPVMMGGKVQVVDRDARKCVRTEKCR